MRRRVTVSFRLLQPNRSTGVQSQQLYTPWRNASIGRIVYAVSRAAAGRSVCWPPLLHAVGLRNNCIAKTHSVDCRWLDRLVRCCRYRLCCHKDIRYIFLFIATNRTLKKMIVVVHRQRGCSGNPRRLVFGSASTQVSVLVLLLLVYDVTKVAMATANNSHIHRSVEPTTSATMDAQPQPVDAYNGKPLTVQRLVFVAWGRARKWASGMTVYVVFILSDCPSDCPRYVTCQLYRTVRRTVQRIMQIPLSSMSRPTQNMQKSRIDSITSFRYIISVSADVEMRWYICKPRRWILLWSVRVKDHIIIFFIWPSDVMYWCVIELNWISLSQHTCRYESQSIDI